MAYLRRDILGLQANFRNTESVVRVYYYWLKAENIQVSVETELQSVYRERARLVQVIQNLVDNAAKFMKDQENPKIEIGVKQSDRDTVFFVRDNGIGMEPEFFEQIFGLFNMLEANREGTGVGLTLAKRIIEVHGGKIWVQSEGLRKGSVFYFTLKKRVNISVQNEE